MDKDAVREAFRAIPPVNELLDNPTVGELTAKYGRARVVENINKLLDEYRTSINPQKPVSRQQIAEYITNRLVDGLQEKQTKGLRRVINATGIVLHTNLGRAPLPEEALAQMKEVARGYSNLEFDLETGTRGSRHSHIGELISEITGAESAMIVNNNAAAVFLCLNTLAMGREVIISRGQQVEIGGSFRIPDIIARSGAKMVEVGTTNKTRLTDYENAITSDTEVLLKVHTSNYKVTGFTAEVEMAELASLGKQKGITVMEDLGSGSLLDLTALGLPYEPTVQDSIRNGAALVTFSGDKLLGGPQAGIIAGKKELIDRIKKNPLTRMVRCDKSTIAATAAILSLYLNPERVVERIPVLRMMAMGEEELMASARELHSMIKEALGDRYPTEIVDEPDEVGGGSLPGVTLPGKAVALLVRAGEANEMQAKLRKARIPVISRINRDRILFSVRTIERNDYPAVVRALKGVAEVSL